MIDIRTIAKKQINKEYKITEMKTNVTVFSNKLIN